MTSAEPSDAPDSDASGVARERKSGERAALQVDEPSMLWRLGGALVTMRPHQWVKNVFVLAPLVFAKEIFDATLAVRAVGAFGVFCLLAGAVYTINDLVDIEADRAHPVKRNRPIPSGRVPEQMARALAGLLVVLGLGGALYGPLPFAAIAASYFAMNLLYSFKLKNVPYLDVGIISLGFVLRVMAGGYGTKIHVSFYLLACTALLALFLGFGKRRHELATAAVTSGKTRKSLDAYSERGLDVALAVTALSTVGVYLAYTLDAHTRVVFQSDHLYLTTAFVVLGVARFLTIVRTRTEAESPTQEMLRDGPFVGILLVWVMVVMWIVYNLHPS